MINVLTKIIRRFSGEEGQALVEYALIIALIAVVAIVALSFLGGSVHNAVNNVGSAVNNAAG